MGLRLKFNIVLAVFSMPIGAGAHTLKWSYQKDASVDVGLDAAYLDGLVTPSFTP